MPSNVLGMAERRYLSEATIRSYFVAALREARTWPGFRDHEPAMVAALEIAPLSGSLEDEVLLLKALYTALVFTDAQ